MAEKIVFPDVPPPRWVFERDCISFPAIHRERNLLCLASIRLLMERFGARDNSEAEGMRAYEMNRPRLQLIAKAQILAGKVSTANEVLLTTESFAFKEVSFSDRVRESPYYFRLVRQVTGELEEVLDPSAGLAMVEWDRVEDPTGRPLYLLDMRDFIAQVSVTFAADELEHSRGLRSRLYRLWGDLLQDRNRKQLQELLGAGQTEE